MVAKACQYLRAALSPPSPALTEATGRATRRNPRRAARNIIVTSLSSRFGMSQNKSQSEIRKPKGLSQFNKSEGIELDKVTWVVSSTGQVNGGSFGSSEEGC